MINMHGIGSSINSFSYLAVDGATNLMRDAMSVNRDAIASWNERWDTIFDSASPGNAGIFEIISQMSIYAGVVAITIWMVNELKDFDGDGQLFKRSFYTNLMWAMFVMALLAPNGDRLGDLVQGLHKFGQVFNQQALSYQMDSVALEDAIRASVARGTLTNGISAQVSQCEAYIGQEQFNCLRNANGQVKQMIDGYEDEWLLELPDTYVDVEQNLNYILEGKKTNGELVNNFGIEVGDVDDSSYTFGSERAAEGMEEGEDRAVGRLSGAFLGSLGSIFQGFTHGILLAVQWAFVNSLEMAMLLTGMVAPFALALSFIPGTGRPIVAWALAYVSMIMVQFYYNVFTGIMGVVIVNSNAHDMNGYLIVLALFGPVLAIKLAQGGGMAVFDTITSGSIGLTLASIGLGTGIGKSRKGKG
jgi:hypothetical protein